VIDGMRHAVRCPYLRTPREPCDCHPLDESRAMRGADVLRIFKPLPQDEADALREYLP
jgi:hypothetical protein